MDRALKERLIGAAVLVALVVLIVPALLTGPRGDRAAKAPEESQRTEIIDLDHPPGATPAAPQTSVLPVATPPVTDATDMPPAAPTTSVAPTLPPTVAAGNAPVSAPTPVPNAKPDGALPAKAEVSPAGSTAKTDVKPDAKSQAKADNKPETKGESKGDLKGVRTDAAAGKADSKPDPKTPQKADAKPDKAPLPEPKVAEKAPAKPGAHGSPKNDAKVAASTPAPAPAPTASAVDATGGWVVQLGSFAARENAEKLARELKAKKFKAFVSEFRGGGKTLWRVRVGPEQDRARIDRIAERLQGEGHKGNVAPAQ